MVAMDELLHLEVSPGTVTTTECTKCGHDALTFDTVALRNTGVAWAGTITRCPQCNPSQ